VKARTSAATFGLGFGAGATVVTAGTTVVVVDVVVVVVEEVVVGTANGATGSSSMHAGMGDCEGRSPGDRWTPGAERTPELVSSPGGHPSPASAASGSATNSSTTSATTAAARPRSAVGTPDIATPPDSATARR
jgi:hypothetical protein